MAVQTIGVEITGEAEVKRVSRLVNDLRKSVLDVEKALRSLGKGRQSFSFSIDFGNNGFEQALQNTRNLQEVSQNLTRNLHENNEKLKSIAQAAAKLSIANPFKSFLSGAKIATQQVTALVTKVNGLVTNLTSGTLQKGFYTLFNGVRQISSSIAQETAKIGDSIVTYELQMNQLGLTSEQINKNLKQLTDYGKNSVFNASDLVSQAGDYQAYGLSGNSAIDLVKALAGVTAQTADPNQSMEHVGMQLKDMLARQKVAWQDIKFMKGWFNAQGSAKISEILDQKAAERGFTNTIDAIEHGALSVQDVTQAVTQVGLRQDFQKLVTTFATPKQALDNLKEELANTFIVPRYTENGSVSDAPLSKIYRSTVGFIASLTNIVKTEAFSKGVNVVGRDLSKAIDNTVFLGKTLNFTFGSSFRNSLQQFYTQAKKGANNVGTFNKELNTLSQSIIDFVGSVGYNTGSGLAKISKNLVSYVSSIVKSGEELSKGKFLDGVSYLISFYDNLVSLGNKSGAVRSFAERFTELYKTLNNIVSNNNVVYAAKGAVSSIDGLFKSIIGIIKAVGGNGQGLKFGLNLVDELASFFADVFKRINVSTGNGAAFRRFFQYFLEAVRTLKQGLSDTLVSLGSGFINALSTESARKTLNLLAQFIANCFRIAEGLIKTIGFGDTQRGFETVINFLNGLLSLATNITEFLADHSVIATAVAAVILYTTTIRGAINSINNAFSSISGTQVLSNNSLGGFVGGVKGLGTKALNSVSSVAYTGLMSRALKSGDLAKAAKYEGILANIAGNTLGLGKFFTGLKNLPQSLKSGSLSVTKLSKGLLSVGSLATTLAGDFISSKVNESKLPQGVKSFTGAGVGALQGGTIGSLFGPWGAGIGALIGGINGYMNAQGAKKAASQAKKEGEEIAKQNTAALIQQAKDMAVQSKSIVVSYYDAISKSVGADGKLVSSQKAFSDTVAYIQSLSQVSGDSIKTTLTKLGTDIKSIPENINGMCVRIGSEIVKLTDLQEQTGLSSEELLGIIKQMNSAIGEAYTVIVDEQGNIIKQLANLTPAGQEEQNKQLETVRKALADVGKNVNNMALSEISAYGKALEEVNKGGYNSINEQKEAYASVLSQGNKKLYDTYMAKSIEELRQMGQEQAKIISENVGTAGERKAVLLEKLAKITGGTKDKLIESFMNATVQEVEQAIAYEQLKKSTKGVKGNRITKLQEHLKQLDAALFVEDLDLYAKAPEYVRSILESIGVKDKELQDKVMSKITKHNNTLHEAVNAVKFDEDQGKTIQEQIEILKQKSIELFNSTIGLYQSGQISLEQASQLLIEKGININSIDPSNLNEAGKELYNYTKGTIDKAATKIKRSPEAVESQDWGWLTNNPLVDAVKSLWDWASGVVKSVGDWFKGVASGGSGKNPTKRANGGLVPSYRALGGVIPEYHDNGGVAGIDWSPRGTDTVPAMLTPGEFVLRRKVVKDLGLNFLTKLNTQGKRFLQNTPNKSIIYNVYNTNNAKVTQNVDNKSQFMNAFTSLDKLMRYV